MKLIALTTALVASGTLAVMAAPASAAYKGCPDVSFTPGSSFASSHYGASSITVLHTTCATARKVVLKAEGKGARTYQTRGFTCRAGSKFGGARPFTCKNGTKRIKFVAVGNG